MIINALSEKTKQLKEGFKKNARKTAGAAALVVALSGTQSCGNSEQSKYKITNLNTSEVQANKIFIDEGIVQVPYVQEGDRMLFALSNGENNTINYRYEYLGRNYQTENHIKQGNGTIENRDSLGTHLGTILDSFFQKDRQAIPEKVQDAEKSLLLIKKAKELGIEINSKDNKIKFNIAFEDNGSEKDYNVKVGKDGKAFRAIIDGPRRDNEELKDRSIEGIFNNIRNQFFIESAENTDSISKEKVNQKLDIAEKVFTKIIEQNQ